MNYLLLKQLMHQKGNKFLNINNKQLVVKQFHIQTNYNSFSHQAFYHDNLLHLNHSQIIIKINHSKINSLLY